MTRTHFLLGLKLDFSVYRKESKETKMASERAFSFMSMSNYQLLPLVHYTQSDVSVSTHINETASMGQHISSFLLVWCGCNTLRSILSNLDIRILHSKITII